MAKKPPRTPRRAWEEENRAPQKSRSSPESNEEPPVLPLRTDATWLPVYRLEQDNVERIKAFVKSPTMDEHQKIGFLESICCLLCTARYCGLHQGLDVFCHKYHLAEMIKMLLQQEPMDQLFTKVRHLAMDAIAELSSVETGLAGQEESLLEICCRSVFFLPPKEEFSGLDTYYFIFMLESTDNMLWRLVLNSPAPRASEKLRNILQVLLSFTSSESAVVRERALGRIRTLSQLLFHHHTLRGLHPTETDLCSPVSQEELSVPLLGQLLGRLILFRFAKDEASSPAWSALWCLYNYLQHQESRPKPKGEGEELKWEEENSAQDLTMAFANSLYPRERADFVCVAIEAMRDSSIFEKWVAEDILDLVMRDVDFWLADVPSIVRSIHESLQQSSRDSAWCKLGALLILLVLKHPRALTISMVLNIPSSDSAGMDMWELILTMPKTLEVLRELLGILQDTGDTSIPALVAMASSEDAGEESHVESSQDHPSLRTVSLLLESLLVLSERPDLARKLQILLPHMTGRLQNTKEEIKIKALVIIRNAMGHLQKKEASPIAVQLVGDLLPLFDGESSQLRELSIRLFRVLLDSVVRSDKRRMRSSTRGFLVPLFLRMSDQSDSVAEASREALLAAAMLLGWRELQHLLKTRQTWRIAECLLERSRKRAEEYLDQSVPYLEDAQAPLREAAIRFIGLAARPLRGRNELKLEQICRALETLPEESDPVICSLAVQTVLILRRPPVRRTLGWRLRALCC
ncbi:uncharacterized protein LOC115603225 [Strigops habroptila]|uniref:uncharacterized protein LOC115603225 n=1 Tax=Strigops habroptila TaxID=2489341 RepID=UPI0011CF0764|nr:uncharacterized protein LOC115603225 [Strigops habroptila]